MGSFKRLIAYAPGIHDPSNREYEQRRGLHHELDIVLLSIKEAIYKEGPF
jgi:hypothetical protein